MGMVYKPMPMGFKYSNPCLEGATLMGRPRKQEKLEDIFWAPPVKEYKNVGEPKTITKAKRKRLLNQYIELYNLAEIEFTKSDQYFMDKLVAKHIPE